MCGIVGMVSGANVVPDVVAALRRLEYRGYDSAGVAVVADGSLGRVRAAGKIARLDEALANTPLAGQAAIGHTRWATHGRPTDENAHPHVSCDGRIALVHNGIIENYGEIRRRLQAKGHELTTETDTEVLVHLVEDHLASTGHGGAAKDLHEAVMAAARDVRGIHAVAVLSADEPDTLVIATNGPPALVGVADGLGIVSSDLAPILPHARHVVFLEEGDSARVRRGEVVVRDAKGDVVLRAPRFVEWNPVETEKGGYKHFMLKEIFEQPRTLHESLAGHVVPGTPTVVLDDAGLTDADLRSIQRLVLLGCGTSWHAALVGRYLVETLARVPCDVDVASEFRQRDPLVLPGTLAVAVTQSGETADTVAAMKEAKARGARILSVCNVLGSLATRLSDGVLHARAGIEIGVASTKAFTAQVLALTLLAIRLGQARGTLKEKRARELVEGLRSLPRLVETMLAREARAAEVARATVSAEHYLFLGRGILHPVALEGALKLKEISYVHAEGYPAGEMKHGPIALLDARMPVLGLCTRGAAYEKMFANLQEAKARDAVLVVVATDGDERAAALADHLIEVPPTDELLAPIVVTVPLQLLAYHVAVRRGCDVDQPRNLAKSVTVE